MTMTSGCRSSHDHIVVLLLGLLPFIVKAVKRHATKND